MGTGDAHTRAGEMGGHEPEPGNPLSHAGGMVTLWCLAMRYGAGAPRPNPHLLVSSGCVGSHYACLSSAILSCSHCPAEGQGARGFHHPGQPLLPGSLWPRHESCFSASHGHAAEQERYCVPFSFPRRDAFHRSARASGQLGLLGQSCPWVCADVAGSLSPRAQGSTRHPLP